MPFVNKIRLPLKLVKPQFPTERTVFRKANGVSQTISSVTRKTLEGETDWMPEKWHQKAVIMLQHDDVTIEGDTYFGKIIMESDYSIEWQNFLGYPTAPAKFKIQVTPFDASNSNCQTCEAATQVELTDDTFPTDLAENTPYTLNVAANDSICCYPAVFSIVGVYNEAYLSSASINQSGVVSVIVGDNVQVANNALLLTYRVTCSNGGYDEANVYGNIAGSVAACLAPLLLRGAGTSETTAAIFWNEPTPAPSGGYLWSLYKLATPGLLEQSGTNLDGSLGLTGLTPGTDYIIYVRSSCGGGQVSNDAAHTFITQSLSTKCGEYEVTYQLQPTGNPPVITVGYINCYGIFKNAYIVSPGITTTICVLEFSPGVPRTIFSDYPTDVEYLGPC